MMNLPMHRFQTLELHLVNPSDSRWMLESIVRFRSRVYAQRGALRSGDLALDEADLTAWHLIAADGERLLGCIRFHVFDICELERFPAAALANSRCIFSEGDRRRCVEAIAGYASTRWASVGGPMVQAGGLAVDGAVRRSGIAAALCMAGNALIRFVGASCGLVFAAVESGSADIGRRLGCSPIRSSPGPLEPLIDRFHDSQVSVMSIDPRAVTPEVDAQIDEIGFSLRREFVKLEAAYG
ncbi:hypothetical protein [Piscinibacter defluvii]|uniref:hypothetical protein n=1 Tax=Piscinibacter defluvii TaxID=1796922 RepID=UPI000FDD73B4|nr:hypothetical protein [Piscinibacter defluvii]